jgi:hypothetical protein
MSMIPPNLYVVLPNTALTSPDYPHYFEANRVWHRVSHRAEGMHYIDFDQYSMERKPVTVNYLVKTKTLTTKEMMSAYYMFVLLAHVSSFTRWLDTPLSYLKNYHGKTEKEFIKAFQSKKP